MTPSCRAPRQWAAVEHYEISGYGTLLGWAEELGHDDIVRFLTTNLNRRASIHRGRCLRVGNGGLTNERQVQAVLGEQEIGQEPGRPRPRAIGYKGAGSRVIASQAPVGDRPNRRRRAPGLP